MTTNPSASGKATASTDIDFIMPLLFASLGNPSISFEKIAAMDEQGHTASSFEHKFRKWRQKGREIAAAHPELAGQPATPNKSTPAKKGAGVKSKAKQTNGADEEDGDGEGSGSENGVVKKGSKNAAVTKSPSAAKGKANSAKKRTATKANSGEDDEEEEATPTKKAKTTKKGTAKSVKKTTNNASASDAENDELEPEPSTPKAKGRAKATPKSPAARKAGANATKEKQWKAEAAVEKEQALVNEKDEDLGLEDGSQEQDVKGGEEAGMTEMKFEEEA